MAEHMLSSLDLFQPNPPVQTNILAKRLVSYKPISSLDNRSVIEFLIKDSGDAYKDLNSIYLKLKVKLCKKDGTDYDASATNQPGVVNNILHSLFEQCNVYFNGTLVTPSEDNYHYRSYLENVLNYGRDASKTHLRNVGWELDTGDDINKMDATNSGYTKRKEWFKNSAEVELYGKLHVDVFNQVQLMMDRVDIGIRLLLSSHNFYLMGGGDDGMLKILDAALYVQHFDINPSILVAHNKILENNNARYHYKRTELKTFTIPSGGRTLSLDNAIVGRIPNTIIFAMVDNEAYAGSLSKNPFALSHYSLENFSLFVNGVQVPSEGLQCNFSSKKYWARAYDTIFSGSGIKHYNRGNQITYDMFGHGYFMLIFDLTPDDSGNEDYISLGDRGVVRIEARFEKELTKTVTCLLFSEYDATLEIDKNRNIMTNF